MRCAIAWVRRPGLEFSRTTASKRLERLEGLAAQLDVLARSKTSVPTALAAPLLDMLDNEVSILEKVLEVDSSVHHLGPLTTFFLATFVAEHKQLVEELDAVQALRRRVAAVRFTAFNYAVDTGGDGKAKSKQA